MRVQISEPKTGAALRCRCNMNGGQLSERDAKGVRSRRPFRRRRDPQNVVLISRDSSLASLLEAMIARPRALKIVGSSSEFPGPEEFSADTFVLDLPYRVRWPACQQVRERYSGRMIVTVSSERETEGWPPDPACWFLVRPFGAEDVLRALRAPVPPGPAARAPVATRRRMAARAAPPDVLATEVVTEVVADRDSDQTAPEPVGRLSSDDSLWEVGAAATSPPPVSPPAVDLPVVDPSLVMPPVTMPPLAVPPAPTQPVGMPPVPAPPTPTPMPVEAEAEAEA